MYSRSNSTKSPASGASNVSELLLTSPSRESERICVRVNQSVFAHRAMQVAALVYLRSSRKHITEVEYRRICRTRAEGCLAK